MMATAKVNGAEIYYEETGSGPPIILSPSGLQGVASSYEAVIEALSQEHRVVVYDRRFDGHRAARWWCRRGTWFAMTCAA